MSFMERILPAPVGGGFAMADYWVWGGSVVLGDDARYHMFASRWPKDLPFFEGYQAYSEVVRAVSDTPGGPYVFQDIVLPARDAAYWDGRMTHNPAIHKFGDTYLLFYIGSTYPGPEPTADALWRAQSLQTKTSYANIRIGLATSSSVFGPWERCSKPVLEPRPSKWDSTIVTNPAPCVQEDGRILLLYRSNTPHGLRLGVAAAEHFTAPFHRLSDVPVLQFEGGHHVEDPFVWWQDDHFELLAKDMTGGLTGEMHAGIHAMSGDGIIWALCDPPMAYSRRIVWDDGTETLQGCVERPQLLFGNGEPVYLFAATCDGPGGFRACSKSWTVAIPLASEN